MSDEDLYEVLGVPRDASEDDIRKAYRRQARKVHPDLNPGDADAEERFKRLSGAFEVLNDPQKRALYDELGADAAKIGYDPERAEEYRQWKRRAEAAAGFGGGFPPGFGGMGGGGYGGVGDLEDLLGELFRERGAAGPRRGRDVEAQLTVPFLDAARGASAAVQVPRGDGTAKTLTVTIPAGIEGGQRLRLGGQGAPGREGGPAGDLFVRVEIEPHPVYRREGLDLALDVPITVPEALAGAVVEVPTLGGSVKVRVPAGAQNGQRLRLRGKGIAPPKGPAGDLMLTLSVVLPDAAAGDEEARARLAEELSTLYAGADVRAGLREGT